MVDNYSAPHTFNHMVKLNPARLDEIFHALADGTRRAMLLALAEQPASVGALAAPLADPDA